MPDYSTLSNTDLEPYFITEMVALTQSHQEPGTLVLQPLTAYTLIGLMQLACRHPSCTGHPRDVAMQLVGYLSELFGDETAIRESIRRGWNTVYDED